MIVTGLGALGGALGGVLIALTMVTQGMLDPIARSEIDREYSGPPLRRFGSLARGPLSDFT